MATITTHPDMWSISIPLTKASTKDPTASLTLTFYIAKQGGTPEKYDCHLVDIELSSLASKIEGMEFLFKPTFQVSEEGFTTDVHDNTWSRERVVVDASDGEEEEKESKKVVLRDVVLKATGGAGNRAGQQFMAKAMVGEENEWTYTLTSENWED